MATSKNTKIALGNAMKELMVTMPFSKISIEKITLRCNMNRKSFYYHFRDKYELVNWIFDTEINTLICNNNCKNAWDFYEVMLNYFYENRTFYRRALKIEGQNAFSEHFKDVLRLLFAGNRKKVSEDETLNKFYTDFFADAFACSLLRWLLDKNCLLPKDFLHLFRCSAEKSALEFYNEINLDILKPLLQ